MNWQHVLRRKVLKPLCIRFIDMESTEQIVYDDHGVVTILETMEEFDIKNMKRLDRLYASILNNSFTAFSVPAQEDKNISQYAD